MSSQNLLAMEGGVPFSPKTQSVRRRKAVVARVSVDIESLELGEATPQARTPPRRAVSNPEAISEEEESQGFRDPPRRSTSNPLPQPLARRPPPRTFREPQSPRRAASANAAAARPI